MARATSPNMSGKIVLPGGQPMRLSYLLALLLVVSLGSGCKKKPPPAPPPEPEAEATAEVEEPPERLKWLKAIQSNRGDRREAVEALAALADSDPKVVEDLADAMSTATNAGAGKTHPTQPGSVREAAVAALLRSGPKGEAILKERGFAILRGGLTDKDPTVREHTAHTIGLIGPPAKPLASSLQRLCTDPDPNVHGAAFDALRTPSYF